MEKHTKGPWKTQRACGIGIKGADGKSVAAIASTIRRPVEENEANARFIATAPRLEEALWTLLQCDIGDDGNHKANACIDLALAVLEEAGSTCPVCEGKPHQHGGPECPACGRI